MHLRCVRSQVVELRALNVKINFAVGEAILTEISRKFDLNIIKQQLTEQGLYATCP